MRTRVEKWGNSLALRIPQGIADEVGLREDSPVELLLQDGTVVVRPVRRPAFSLEQLLTEVTDENLHREVETGLAVGDEAW